MSPKEASAASGAREAGRVEALRAGVADRPVRAGAAEEIEDTGDVFAVAISEG
jgi:hypothetical protein